MIPRKKIPFFFKFKLDYLLNRIKHPVNKYSKDSFILQKREEDAREQGENLWNKLVIKIINTLTEQDLKEEASDKVLKNSIELKLKKKLENDLRSLFLSQRTFVLDNCLYAFDCLFKSFYELSTYKAFLNETALRLVKTKYVYLAFISDVYNVNDYLLLDNSNVWYEHFMSNLEMEQFIKPEQISRLSRDYVIIPRKEFIPLISRKQINSPSSLYPILGSLDYNQNTLTFQDVDTNPTKSLIDYSGTFFDKKEYYHKNYVKLWTEYEELEKRKQYENQSTSKKRVITLEELDGDLNKW